jgi:hypothetical protein
VTGHVLPEFDTNLRGKFTVFLAFCFLNVVSG